MKFTVFMATIFFGLSSMACNELVGTWQCKSEDGSSQVVKYELVNGSIVSTNSQGAPITWDGKGRTENGIYYNGAVVCKGSTGHFQVTMTAPMKDEQGNEIMLHGIGSAIYKVEGNALTTYSKTQTIITADNQVLSDETETGSQTCTK